MTRALPRELLVGMVVALVLLQANSCCCLGGAVIPARSPQSISNDLAYQMRDRFNETAAEARLRGGAFTFEFSDRELTSYIVMLLQSGAGEFPARDMQVRFGDGTIEIWATFIDIAPMDLPSYVRATVEATEGRLVFHILEANAGPIAVPGAMREMTSRILGDTLDELTSGFDVQRVQIVPGSAVLTGYVTGDFPDLPERL